VVDDNADMRAYLIRLLTDEYRVVSAGNGAEALEKIRQLKPDLVVADIMMPVMTGNELTRAIRQDDSLRAIPIILLTARAGTEARVQSLEAGADDYVSKPFNEEELLARIKNQLRIHRQSRGWNRGRFNCKTSMRSSKLLMLHYAGMTCGNLSCVDCP
jgi:DNA-binding response OmpR family regulator